MDAAQMTARLRKIAERAHEAALDGLRDVGQEVLDESRGLCPTGSTGALKASGALSEDRSSGQVAVHYGRGRSGPYAQAVHEDMEAEHDNGQAKFLELPAEKTGRGRGAQIIGRRVQGAVK